MNRPQRVLVVDDDATFATVLAGALGKRGYDCVTAGSVGQAAAAAGSTPPDLAVVDLRLGRESGLTVVAQLAALSPRPRILVLTGYASIATAVEAIKLGAVNYLPKPADADMILNALKEQAILSPDTGQQPPPVSRLEWEHLQRVMVDCGGNVSQAARLLGMHRRTLQRKLKKKPWPETPG